MILPIDYPNIDIPIDGQHELILLTMCLWGEARGEDALAKLAVGCVIRNRVNAPRWWGDSWKSVILKPYQFSSFNVGDPNRKKLLVPLAYGTPQEWIHCFYAALGVYENHVGDFTGGANHYYDISLPEPPDWAKGKEPVFVQGRFRFFKL